MDADTLLSLAAACRATADHVAASPGYEALRLAAANQRLTRQRDLLRSAAHSQAREAARLREVVVDLLRRLGLAREALRAHGANFFEDGERVRLDRQRWRACPAALRAGVALGCDYGLSSGTWVAFDAAVDLEALFPVGSGGWAHAALRWGAAGYAARFLGLGGFLVLYCAPLHALCLPSFVLRS